MKSKIADEEMKGNKRTWTLQDEDVMDMETSRNEKRQRGEKRGAQGTKNKVVVASANWPQEDQ